MRVHLLLLCVALLGAEHAAIAKKEPKETWAATRVTDPVTGDSTCVVAAYDRVGRTEFSRFGYLYPIVENNSRLGLLVGASTGGQYRTPSGDILWCVDSNPHRELKAVDNPPGNSTIALTPYKTGIEVADKAMADAMANAQNMTNALLATSTVASGEKAKAMLQEMLAGRTLIYRAAQAAPAYGLPSSQTYKVGQYTNQGLKPIPIDDSFRRGLAECGIAL